MRREAQTQRRYFAAANSADGFLNYFPEVFGPHRCRRLFVIRGGPGTGKSSLMRHVGAAAEEKGRAVTYYHCSSDADSLDGVFLENDGIGLIDGTSPHPWEPTFPGAFETSVDLGRFWRADLLADQRGRIEELVREKKQGYARAYRYLSAYGILRRTADEALLPALDGEKLRRAAERTLTRYAARSTGVATETVGLCDSFGMGGRVRLDTYEAVGTWRVSVRDAFGMGHLFLKELLALCRRRGVSVRLSRDPLLPERIDALELTETGVTFSLLETEEDGQTVNMQRFLCARTLRETRGLRRESEDLGRRLLSLAAAELEQVRVHHFSLESIYGAAMDFNKKEAFEQAFLEELTAQLP